MKTRSFRHGNYTYKAYMKSAGKGWEVGFTFAGKPLFVGNFIYKKEANAWFTLMNKEVRTFSKRFWVTKKSPRTFYKKFLSNHLYKTYYAWLNKNFTKYTNQYTRALNKDVRKYKQLKKNWKPSEKVALRTAA